MCVSKSSMGGNREGMCKNIRAVEKAIENEKVIPKDVCATCRFRDDCKYLEQDDRIRKLSRDGKPLVILLAHAYIDKPIPRNPELDWAIIDDMPSNLLVESEVYSPDVAGGVLKKRAADQYGRAIAEFERMMRIRDAAPALVETIIRSAGSPVDLPDDVLEWPWRRKYRMLIEAAQGKHAIWWEGDQVGVSRLLDTSRLSAILLTFLDGTANINIIRAALGNDIYHAHIVVERDAEVTMVTGRRFSNTSMIGRDDGSGDEESRAFLPRLRKGLSRFSGAFAAGPRKVLERIRV